MAVSASRASSSPLSSPPSLSSASSPLISSPTRTSSEIETFGDTLFDSTFVSEAGRPFDPRHTISHRSTGMKSASDNHAARQPSPVEAQVTEKSQGKTSYTKRKLRSNLSQAEKMDEGRPAVGHHISTNVKRGTKRKASISREPLAAVDRASPGPLVGLVNQIGRNSMVTDIRETIEELKARPYRMHALAGSLHGITTMQADASPTQIIQATPNLVRHIESNLFNQHLSRMGHRIALANFYCAYRTAHTQPLVFLQELDQDPSQIRHRCHARLRNKSGVIKKRFMELVFCQSPGKRDWKKDSNSVHNWQKAGKPWFELIHRFGTGILLLVPDEVTNRRSV